MVPSMIIGSPGSLLPSVVCDDMVLGMPSYMVSHRSQASPTRRSWKSVRRRNMRKARIGFLIVVNGVGFTLITGSDQTRDFLDELPGLVRYKTVNFMYDVRITMYDLASRLNRT